MTLLVSWIGVGTHGIASAYIAADSRVSWKNFGRYDHARKVFSFRRSPDILGYCGDAFFSTMFLSQITELADQGLLFSNDATCEERFEAIKEKLFQQFSQYPTMIDQIMSPKLQILHLSRDTNNLIFECRQIEWSRKDGWKFRNESLPTHSEVLFTLGSGAVEFNNNFERYQQGSSKNTSRNIFHCFCDTLMNIEDTNCGGVPQLVGIYRKPNSPGITFGIIIGSERYFLGLPVNNRVDFSEVEWRNDLFERCSGKSMERLKNAQRQPDQMRKN